MNSKFKNIFFQLKQKLSKFKALSFLTNGNNYFIKALLFFVIYQISNIILYPTKADIEFIVNEVKNQSKIEFQFKEFTGSAKEYFLTINNKRYIYKMFTEDILSDTKKLEENKIVLPKEEMGFIAVNQFMYFNIILLYISYLYLFLGVKTFLTNLNGASQMLLDKEKSKIKFSDVQGIDHIRKDLEEVVQHFLDSELVKSYGGKPLKGVIMNGPPGTGKTLMAKAIAGESNANFIAVSGSQFVELYVGNGAKRVRELFEQARKNVPCVIFIDEIDAMALKRGSHGSHSEYDHTVNEMLAQMDGFKDNTGILVIAATNKLENIDDALLRPGRFDRKIKVDKPSVDGRKAILKLYIDKNPKMNPNIDIDLLAKSTTNFSGADLKGLVDEAIYLAIKEKSNHVELQHFMTAKDKIVMGAKRDIQLSDTDKKLTAFHEIGHAYISYLKKVGTVAQVSIIPRGEALGVTQMTEDDVHSYSNENLENRLMMLMGGKVAEKVFCNHQSTGASQDLKQATAIAQRMVCEWGMSSLGPINFGFDSLNYARYVSDQMKFIIDQEVLKICKQAEDKTTALLIEHKESVEKLTQLLLEKETLYSEEFLNACKSITKKEA